MKNIELQNILSQHPDDVEIWLPVYNGHTVTYGVLDRVCDFDYGSVYNDFYGTPGRMDRRLFDNHTNMDEHILLLDSDFDRFPNKAVDIGSDDINFNIKTLNGGDPDIVWHCSGFAENCDNKNEYIRKFYDDSFVSYNTLSEMLTIRNNKENLHFQGKLTGIEDIRTAMMMCRVPFKIIV